MIVVFDLDGTLCNIEHRLGHIQSEPQDWAAFYRACIYDVEITPLVRVAAALWHAGHRLEFWSGRSEEVREETGKWLASRGLRYHLLRLRPKDDYRPDHELKARWLEGLSAAERPVLAFEDREQVVQMWRSKDVLCCQVAPGNF